MAGCRPVNRTFRFAVSTVLRQKNARYKVAVWSKSGGTGVIGAGKRALEGRKPLWSTATTQNKSLRLVLLISWLGENHFHWLTIDCMADQKLTLSQTSYCCTDILIKESVIWGVH